MSTILSTIGMIGMVLIGVGATVGGMQVMKDASQLTQMRMISSEVRK
jgi:hypothetical protein